MVDLTLDARIKFQQTVSLPGPTAMVSAEAFGGAIVAMQVGVYDANDKLIDGVGFAGHGEVVTSEADGVASWLFEPKPEASYVKWGLVAIRSAAGLGQYSVNGKIRDQNGNTLAAGRVAGRIAQGSADGGVFYDGVFVSVPRKPGDLPAGPRA